MGLELNIKSARGRRSDPLDFDVNRELTAVDMQRVEAESAGTAPAQIQRLTQRHHSLARLLANGTPEAEAALITGYGVSRVSILKNSPAFQELLSLYLKQKEEQFSGLLEQMAGVAKDAVSTLQERLEENPERFSNRDLAHIATELGDRGISEDEKTGPLPDIIELITPDEKSSDTAGA